MNTTTEICNCLVKNATQLLQEEEDKRRSEAHFHELYFLFSLVYLTAFSFFAFMWFAPPKHHPKSVTRIPTIPFATGHFIESKDYKDLTPGARILVDPTANCQNWCTNKLNAIMRMIFEIDKEENYSVPWNTRMISIKMEGFKHGKRFHDFEPIEGPAPGSYFTYQMYGTDVWGIWIQVTRYVERGVSYIAGFCIYIPNGFADLNKDLVETFWNSEKYPGRIRGVEERDHMLDAPVSIEFRSNLQAKYCPRLQEFMVTWEENGVVMHQEWKEEFREMKKEEKVCGVCTELLSDPLV
ncbi:unnamed protein product [Caenorhabditis brenneri]